MGSKQKQTVYQRLDSWFSAVVNFFGPMLDAMDFSKDSSRQQQAENNREQETAKKEPTGKAVPSKGKKSSGKKKSSLIRRFLWKYDTQEELPKLQEQAKRTSPQKPVKTKSEEKAKLSSADKRKPSSAQVRQLSSKQTDTPVSEGKVDEQGESTRLLHKEGVSTKGVNSQRSSKSAGSSSYGGNIYGNYYNNNSVKAKFLSLFCCFKNSTNTSPGNSEEDLWLRKHGEIDTGGSMQMFKPTFGRYRLYLSNETAEKLQNNWQKQPEKWKKYLNKDVKERQKSKSEERPPSLPSL